jgi:subtilisin family serine protease
MLALGAVGKCQDKAWRPFLLVSFLLVLLSAGSAAAQAPNQESARFRDGTVLAGFVAGASQQEAEQIITSVGAQHLRTIGHGTYVLRVPLGGVDATVKALLTHPQVRYAEPDFIERSDGVPNDPFFSLQWGFQNTGQSSGGQTGVAGADEKAVSAWDITHGSSSVVVAVVDTGIEYTHPDLAANVWSNPGGINGCAAGTHGYNVLTSVCDPMDDDTVYNGHGTHVSGIIGAVTNNGTGVAGVNWQTSLLGVKWVDASGDGATSDLITALDWVVSAKQAGVNIRVVNDSQTWPGTAASQALSDEIDVLGSNDILFVTASGNTAQDNDTVPRYPCVYDRPTQICVAASDNTDHLWSSANWGPNTVNLAAPGFSIYSTLRGASYGYISGGSMAAAQVSGAAALILSTGYQPVATLKATILNNVDVLSALSGLVNTSGRLDICKAISGCGAPTNTALPVISGTVQEGSPLATSNGAWTQSPTSYTYQWNRCDTSGANCAAIANAIQQTYPLTANDVGSTLRATVTAHNAIGTNSATSLQTIVVPGTSPTITTQSLPAGTQGAAYSTTLSATGGVPPYSWSLINSTSLPAGLQLNAGTGAITGTPTGNGTTNFTVQVTDHNSKTATQALSITVNPPPTITTTTLPSGSQNVAYSASLAASNGTPPYSWTQINGTSLPAGLQLNSSTGAITGTPTGSGTTNFTVQVTDTNAASASAPLSITVNAALFARLQSASVEGSAVSSISVAFPAGNTAGNLIIAFVRASTTAQTITLSDTAGNTYTQAVSQGQTTDGHQAAIFYAANIKSGANTVTATFSGTNNHPFLAIYEYRGLSTTNPLDKTSAAQGTSATASSGATATTTAANELVFAGLGLPSSSTTTVTAGSSFTLEQQDTRSGGSRAASEDQIVSATGSYAGTFTLSVSDNWSAVVATFLPPSASAPPTITTASLPAGTQNAAYNATLAATGGTSPYSWTLINGTTLPAGLLLNSSTGAITGTPSGTGGTNFTVQVTDKNSETASKALSTTVNPPPSITTTALPNGTQNVAYSASLAASNGTPPYSWTLINGTTLPAGLQLNSSTGAITGSPTGNAGATNFTVQVRDTNGASASANLSITITVNAAGPARVQVASIEGSAVSSVSVAFPAGNTAGNLIIAFVRASTTTQTITLSDTAGNTYTQAVSQGQTTDGHETAIFYAANVKSGANTVTATFSGTNNHPFLAIYEYRGVSTLDKTAGAQGTSAAASSGATATTTAANELVFVGLGLPSSATQTATAGTGFTLEQQDTRSGGSRAASEDQTVTTTGTFSGSFSLSSSSNWTCIVATFR